MCRPSDGPILDPISAHFSKDNLNLSISATSSSASPCHCLQTTQHLWSHTIFYTFPFSIFIPFNLQEGLKGHILSVLGLFTVQVQERALVGVLYLMLMLLHDIRQHMGLQENSLQHFSSPKPNQIR